MTDRPPATTQSYELASIKSADPPPNAEGTGWLSYVIMQGDNAIRGYRQGSLSTVKKEVDEIVARLNDRRQVKPGRMHKAATPMKSPKSGST